MWRGFSVNAHEFIQLCKVKKLPKKMTRWLYLTDKKMFILVVNLLTNCICAFYARRSTQDQTMSRSTSSVWIQGLGQTLEHNYIDFVHQLAVVFSSVQFHWVLALIPSFLFLPLFSFENDTALMCNFASGIALQLEVAISCLGSERSCTLR